MQDVGRVMILVGVALAILGAIVWIAGRTGFRGLPGDVRYESPSVRIYFPIVTCIVLSIVLTGAMWLWRYFNR